MLIGRAADGSNLNVSAAVDTLKVAAEVLPNQEQYYVEAKQKEAQIQAKKLKDNYAERTVLEDIAVRFPNTENGVRALYRAAELTEKFGETDQAREKYNRVILNLPQSKTAIKAQKKITSMDKAAAKAVKKAETAPKQEPKPVKQAAPSENNN